jgi:hypothetical protein
MQTRVGLSRFPSLTLILCTAFFLSWTFWSHGSVVEANGESIYRNHCASCHGSNLAGRIGPALHGAGFTLRWKGRHDTLRQLITATMPPGAAGSL